MDAWTLNAEEPALRADLRRLIQAGCDQITTDDPDILGAMVRDIGGEIASCP